MNKHSHILGLSSLLSASVHNSSNKAKAMKIDKVLVISKLSRYEFEKRKHKNLNDCELKQVLKNRGTDFDRLINFHDAHKSYEETVVSALKNMGIEVEVANR